MEAVRIETGAERVAAALFAGAVAYAAYGVLVTLGLQAPVLVCAAGIGALAYWPCSRVLSGGSRGVAFSLANFSLPEFEFSESRDELLLTERLAPADELLLTDRVSPCDELVLTEADRLDSEAPLVLDDILAAISAEARVVRLFDRKAMPVPGPTAGQLHARIADHRGDGAPRFAPSNASAPPDASQALSAALAELRRSLR